ncbi:MAG TPA: hypothetical protein PK308_08565 [Phycisphaerales bacterium]|nr:hypothetical protein [Phycisphaerales bacterium]
MKRIEFAPMRRPSPRQPKQPPALTPEQIAGPDRRNIYDCQTCGGKIVVIELDPGVTPMFLDCRATQGCAGRMVSRMYRDIDPEAPPTHAWRRPTGDQIAAAKRSNPNLYYHYTHGGLDLWPLAEANLG